MTKDPKKKPPFTIEDLPFGAVKIDHMFEVDWNEDEGWLQPRICPFEEIEIDPRWQSINYAVSCFEGMKAFKSEDGKKVMMFRPIENFKRLNRSG